MSYVLFIILVSIHSVWSKIPPCNLIPCGHIVLPLADEGSYGCVCAVVNIPEEFNRFQYLYLFIDILR